MLRLLTKTKLQKGRNCKHSLPRAFWAHHESVLSAVAEERRDLSTHSFRGSSQPVPLSQDTHPPFPFCSLSHSRYSPVVLPSTPLMCCCNLSTGAAWTWASPPGRPGQHNKPEPSGNKIPHILTSTHGSKLVGTGEEETASQHHPMV